MEHYLAIIHDKCKQHWKAFSEFNILYKLINSTAGLPVQGLAPSVQQGAWVPYKQEGRLYCLITDIDPSMAAPAAQPNSPPLHPASF